MELIADILLTAGALGAGFYCIVLGKRLNKFNDLEKGVGGAVAVLSVQVDDLNRTLTTAQSSASQSAQKLDRLVTRAEETARQLELQMASLHDVQPPTNETVQGSEALTVPPKDEPTEPMFVRRRSENGAH